MLDKYNRKLESGDYFFILEFMYKTSISANLLVCMKDKDEMVYITGTSHKYNKNYSYYKIEMNDISEINHYKYNYDNTLKGLNFDLIDVFNRRLKLGDLVLGNMNGKPTYGIVFGNSFVYTENGFLSKACYVYLVEKPTKIEQRIKDRLINKCNQFMKHVGQVGAVYQNVEDNVIYIDLGICSVNLQIKNKNILYDIDKKYTDNKNYHMYFKIYYTEIDINKNSYLYNLINPNYRGRSEYIYCRYYIENKLLNGLSKKIDPVLRKYSINGFKNITVDTPLNKLGQCIGRIENIEYLIFNEPFNNKEYQITFYK